ncbi:DUF6228 family protein [Streptomyces sp. NPDC056452]|uniref:DUF6228 family protein n=1 Tax=Streptomyces sp. NPDC056452 TaxID=3345821 RepID=UPI00369313B5
MWSPAPITRARPRDRRGSTDFRGREGDQSWQTHDGDLTVSTAFRSGGPVGPTWTVCPWPYAVGGWCAPVTTWLGAGEQMASLASDVGRPR